MSFKKHTEPNELGPSDVSCKKYTHTYIHRSLMLDWS